MNIFTLQDFKDMKELLDGGESGKELIKLYNLKNSTGYRLFEDILNLGVTDAYIKYLLARINSQRYSVATKKTLQSIFAVLGMAQELNQLGESEGVNEKIDEIKYLLQTLDIGEPQRIARETKKAMNDLYEQGFSIKEISQKTGCLYSSVLYHLKISDKKKEQRKKNKHQHKHKHKQVTINKTETKIQEKLEKQETLETNKTEEYYELANKWLK